MVLVADIFALIHVFRYDTRGNFFFSLDNNYTRSYKPTAANLRPLSQSAINDRLFEDEDMRSIGLITVLQYFRRFFRAPAFLRRFRLFSSDRGSLTK